MSNIFQHLVRETGGAIPLNIGVGVLVDPVKSQGLNLDATGAVYAVLDGVINHYNAALPFDVNGRLVVSTTGAQTNVDQCISFSASGAMSANLSIVLYSQGVAYNNNTKVSYVNAIPP